MDSAPQPVTDPEATPATRRIDWAAVVAGAIAGLLVLVVAAAGGAVLRRQVTDFDQSGWRVPLFVLILAGYLLAGWVAERRAHLDAPLTHGALAGVGAFLGWVPLRVAIWIARGEHRGLLSGSDPAFRLGQVFGHLVIASGLGMLGALAARAATRRSARAER